MIKVDELNQELYVQEEIPVLDSCDVLVVGGGLAGFWQQRQQHKGAVVPY